MISTTFLHQPPHHHHHPVTASSVAATTSVSDNVRNDDTNDNDEEVDVGTRSLIMKRRKVASPPPPPLPPHRPTRARPTRGNVDEDNLRRSQGGKKQHRKDSIPIPPPTRKYTTTNPSTMSPIYHLVYDLTSPPSPNYHQTTTAAHNPITTVATTSSVSLSWSSQSFETGPTTISSGRPGDNRGLQHGSDSFTLNTIRVDQVDSALTSSHGGRWERVGRGREGNTTSSCRDAFNRPTSSPSPPPVGNTSSTGRDKHRLSAPAITSKDLGAREVINNQQNDNAEKLSLPLHPPPLLPPSRAPTILTLISSSETREEKGRGGNRGTLNAVTDPFSQSKSQTVYDPRQSLQTWNQKYSDTNDKSLDNSQTQQNKATIIPVFKNNISKDFNHRHPNNRNNYLESSNEDTRATGNEEHDNPGRYRPREVDEWGGGGGGHSALSEAELRIISTPSSPAVRDNEGTRGESYDLKTADVRGISAGTTLRIEQGVLLASHLRSSDKRPDSCNNNNSASLLECQAVRQLGYRGAQTTGRASSSSVLDRSNSQDLNYSGSRNLTVENCDSTDVRDEVNYYKRTKNSVDLKGKANLDNILGRSEASDNSVSGVSFTPGAVSVKDAVLLWNNSSKDESEPRVQAVSRVCDVELALGEKKAVIHRFGDSLRVSINQNDSGVVEDNNITATCSLQPYVDPVTGKPIDWKAESTNSIERKTGGNIIKAKLGLLRNSSEKQSGLLSKVLDLTLSLGSGVGSTTSSKTLSSCLSSSKTNKTVGSRQAARPRPPVNRWDKIHVRTQQTVSTATSPVVSGTEHVNQTTLSEQQHSTEDAVPPTLPPRRFAPSLSTHTYQQQQQHQQPKVSEILDRRDCFIDNHQTRSSAGCEGNDQVVVCETRSSCVDSTLIGQDLLGEPRRETSYSGSDNSNNLGPQDENKEIKFNVAACVLSDSKQLDQIVSRCPDQYQTGDLFVGSNTVKFLDDSTLSTKTRLGEPIGRSENYLSNTSYLTRPNINSFTTSERLNRSLDGVVDFQHKTCDEVLTSCTPTIYSDSTPTKPPSSSIHKSVKKSIPSNSDHHQRTSPSSINFDTKRVGEEVRGHESSLPPPHSYRIQPTQYNSGLTFPSSEEVLTTTSGVYPHSLREETSDTRLAFFSPQLHRVPGSDLTYNNSQPGTGDTSPKSVSPPPLPARATYDRQLNYPTPQYLDHKPEQSGPNSSIKFQAGHPQQRSDNSCYNRHELVLHTEDHSPNSASVSNPRGLTPFVNDLPPHRGLFYSPPITESLESLSLANPQVITNWNTVSPRSDDTFESQHNLRDECKKNQLWNLYSWDLSQNSWFRRCLELEKSTKTDTATDFTSQPIINNEDSHHCTSSQQQQPHTPLKITPRQKFELLHSIVLEKVAANQRSEARLCEEERSESEVNTESYLTPRAKFERDRAVRTQAVTSRCGFNSDQNFSDSLLRLNRSCDDLDTETFGGRCKPETKSELNQINRVIVPPPVPPKPSRLLPKSETFCGHSYSIDHRDTDITRQTYETCGNRCDNISGSRLNNNNSKEERSKPEQGLTSPGYTRTNCSSAVERSQQNNNTTTQSPSPILSTANQSSEKSALSVEAGANLEREETSEASYRAWFARQIIGGSVKEEKSFLQTEFVPDFGREALADAVSVNTESCQQIQDNVLHGEKQQQRLQAVDRANCASTQRCDLDEESSYTENSLNDTSPALRAVNAGGHSNLLNCSSSGGLTEHKVDITTNRALCVQGHQSCATLWKGSVADPHTPDLLVEPLTQTETVERKMDPGSVSSSGYESEVNLTETLKLKSRLNNGLFYRKEDNSQHLYEIEQSSLSTVQQLRLRFGHNESVSVSKRKFNDILSQKGDKECFKCTKPTKQFPESIQHLQYQRQPNATQAEHQRSPRHSPKEKSHNKRRLDKVSRSMHGIIHDLNPGYYQSKSSPIKHRQGHSCPHKVNKRNALRGSPTNPESVGSDTSRRTSLSSECSLCAGDHVSAGNYHKLYKSSKVEEATNNYCESNKRSITDSNNNCYRGLSNNKENEEVSNSLSDTKRAHKTSLDSIIDTYNINTAAYPHQTVLRQNTEHNQSCRQSEMLAARGLRIYESGEDYIAMRSPVKSPLLKTYSASQVGWQGAHYLIMPTLVEPFGVATSSSGDTEYHRVNKPAAGQNDGGCFYDGSKSDGSNNPGVLTHRSISDSGASKRCTASRFAHHISDTNAVFSGHRSDGEDYGEEVPRAFNDVSYNRQQTGRSPVNNAGECSGVGGNTYLDMGERRLSARHRAMSVDVLYNERPELGVAADNEPSAQSLNHQQNAQPVLRRYFHPRPEAESDKGQGYVEWNFASGWGGKPKRLPDGRNSRGYVEWDTIWTMAAPWGGVREDDEHVYDVIAENSSTCSTAEDVTRVEKEVITNSDVERLQAKLDKTTKEGLEVKQVTTVSSIDTPPALPERTYINKIKQQNTHKANVSNSSQTSSSHGHSHHLHCKKHHHHHHHNHHHHTHNHHRHRHHHHQHQQQQQHHHHRDQNTKSHQEPPKRPEKPTDLSLASSSQSNSNKLNSPSTPSPLSSPTKPKVAPPPSKPPPKPPRQSHQTQLKYKQPQQTTSAQRSSEPAQPTTSSTAASMPTKVVSENYSEVNKLKGYTFSSLLSNPESETFTPHCASDPSVVQSENYWHLGPALLTPKSEASAWQSGDVLDYIDGLHDSMSPKRRENIYILLNNKKTRAKFSESLEIESRLLSKGLLSPSPSSSAASTSPLPPPPTTAQTGSDAVTAIAAPSGASDSTVTSRPGVGGSCFPLHGAGVRETAGSITTPLVFPTRIIKRKGATAPVSSTYV